MIGLLAVAAVAAAVLVVVLGGRSRLDAEALESVLEPAIASATRGLYGIDIGRVEGELGSRDLVVHDVRVAPRLAALEALGEAGERPALRFTLEVARFEIRGVSRTALLRGRGLLADRIDVSRPTIRAILDPPADEAPANGRPSPDERATAEKMGHWIEESLRGVPEVRIGTVAIRDGSGTLVREGGAAGTGMGIGTVAITFDNLHIHEDAGGEGYGSLFSDDVRLEASDFDTGTGPGWRLGTLSLSTGAGTARLTDVAFDPRVTVPEYLSRASTREPDRRALWLGRVEASGVDFQRLIERLDLHMRHVLVAGFRVDILDDRHKPSGRADDSPARMPHDLVRELGVGLDVRTVQLRDGYVAYSERHPEATLPGTITFEDISGTVLNLSNHAGRMSEATPAVWSLEAALYGKAPLSMKVTLPLLAAAPTMKVEGTVGSFESELLNPILVPLAGAQLRAGDVRGVTFQVDYAPGWAHGTFDAEYQGLRLGPVDRTTGKRDLKDVVAGFIVSQFVIRRDNPDGSGQSPRTAPIRYAIDPHDAFFKILWQPLRDGAKSIVLD